MKTRIKLPTSDTPVITTRDEAEFIMNELAHIANNQRKLQALRDAEVLRINQKYEAGLAQCAEDLQSRTEILHAWAETHPDAFPKDRKSLTMTSGTIGFRTGTPKLVLLSRAFTWDKVLDLIRARKLLGWIRTKEEVAKDTILAEHCHGLAGDALRTVGLKVTQEESFFAEPDLTVFEPRQTVEA